MFEFKQLAKDVRKGLSRIKQDTAIFHPRQDDQSALWNALTLQKNLEETPEELLQYAMIDAIGGQAETEDRSG